MKFILRHSLLFIITLLLLSSKTNDDRRFHKKLYAFCNEIEQNENTISDRRKGDIERIAVNLMRQESKNLLFVCTHNSRRSHFAQVWFNTAMDYYGVKGVHSQSGGASATQVNERVIETMKTAGLSIKSTSKKENPTYLVSNGISDFSIFSKSIDHPELNKANTIAVLVCSHADQSCPKVSYALHQFELAFYDPRFYDNTPSQEIKYIETQKKIATEMFYLASLLKRQEVFQGELQKLEPK